METNAEMGSEGREAQDERDRARKQAALDEARSELERCGFDAIVLLATYQAEDGGTIGLISAQGNWYAQNGLMEEIRLARAEQTKIDTTNNT